MDRYLYRLLASFCLLSCAGLAQTPNELAAKTSPSWLEEFLQLPVIRMFEPAPKPATSGCAVAALPAIADEQALRFEANAGSAAVVDIGGLTPPTARALARFQAILEKIGGKLKLTSAYRPSPYQAHLQAVWDKWKQLRNVRDEGCQMLRAQVEQEFTLHQLLETQRPVPVSDHTLGIGFDAAVIMPIRAHLRRRVSADSLARMAGLRRPDVLHDPVHFRFVGTVAATTRRRGVRA